MDAAEKEARLRWTMAALVRLAIRTQQREESGFHAVFLMVIFLNSLMEGVGTVRVVIQRRPWRSMTKIAVHGNFSLDSEQAVKENHHQKQCMESALLSLLLFHLSLYPLMSIVYFYHKLRIFKE
ncbi:MAG: hypothetical protein NC412_11075 [Roseburia sp.]|nr:hypothetical protein [Roseburia sp.]MCM1279024.1 hypothetical protein [Robinsoniella sp.]